MINSLDLLKSYEIEIPNIKVNAYARTFQEELSTYGKAVLLNVYRDMLYIREFENTLQESRDKGLYGYRFKYASHLSSGQEAISVGEAFSLKKEDIIFGTHRSHGEYIAKSLRYVEESDDNELLSILENYPTSTYKALAPSSSLSSKEIAVKFILYGAFSEIFARKTGLQRGLGGSMHLHFKPFGIYPNNAIVGGSAPLALGASLYNRINGKGGIVVSNLGDGALNCGAVYESIAFATMNQYKNLWQDKKGLPLLFLVSDNMYARGGNTKVETGSYDNPARLGAGFTYNAMHAESVNGFNPFAVADAVARHREKLLNGEGASLINCITFRQSAHSIGDNVNLKERAEWERLDPIKNYRKALIKESVVSLDEISALENNVRLNVKEAYKMAIDEVRSPILNLENENDGIIKYTFNNEKVDIKPASLNVKNSTLYGSITSKNNDLTLKDSITQGIIESFAQVPSLVAYGEDVRGWDAPSAVFKGLEEYLPYEKLFNTPISEAAIVGASVGYAMRGGVVLSELLYADFLTRAADEIINQAAKWQGLSGGTISLPLTLRLPIGRSYGGQHSQDLSGIISRVAGLKVYYPVTPYDALAVIRASVLSKDPTVIFEPKEYYFQKEVFKEIPKGEYGVENTSLKFEGNDFSVVTIGSALYEALDAIKETNASVDLISLVRLNPIDYAPIIASVKKTGKLIVMGEATLSSGLMSEVVAHVQKECFGLLKAPIEIIGTENSIIPPNGKESGYFNLKEQLIKIIKA